MSSRGRCPTASKVEINSDGSRPSDKSEPGHPDPEKKSGGGGISEKIFSALWAPVWSKNKGVGGGGPPGTLPWIYHGSRWLKVGKTKQDNL